MAMPRDVRRLALLVLYQLDARGEGDLESIRASVEDPAALADEGPVAVDGEFRKPEIEKAVELGLGAFRAHKAADAEMLTLAPDWPAHRQAALDRAVLRLAHFEITTGRVDPKIAVNEAVELAKAFGTDKSPAFVNALLDKVLKRVLREAMGSGQ